MALMNSCKSLYAMVFSVCELGKRRASGGRGDTVPPNPPYSFASTNSHNYWGGLGVPCTPSGVGAAPPIFFIL